MARGVPLEPFSNTIAGKVPYQRSDGRWAIDWWYRLDENSAPVQKRTTHRLKSQVKKRAEQIWEKLLDDNESQWTNLTPITTFMIEVSKPYLDAHTQLRQRTVDKYQSVYENSLALLKGITIGQMSKRRRCLQFLNDYAQAHGTSSAHHAAVFMRKYVASLLVDEDLYVANPFIGLRATASVSKSTRRALPSEIDNSDLALTLDEYHQVFEYLMNRDVTAPAPWATNQHKSSPQTIAKIRAVIDLTLLQMATGLRINEALSTQGRHLSFPNPDRCIIRIPATTSKTSQMRDVEVLLAQVARRLQASDYAQNDYIAGTPTDRSKPWNTRNAHGAIRALYDEMADKLDIEKLLYVSSHSWRRTLNTILENATSIEQRAAGFGHSVLVNQSHYKGHTDMNGFASTARSILEAPSSMSAPSVRTKE